MPYSFTLPNIRKEAAALWHLAWPVLVGQLATVGMGVADVAMTGHTSAAELAAVALGTSVWSIILVTVNGTMMAINSVVAHEVGAGAFDRIPHSVRQALWKSVGVGVLAVLAANLATLLFNYLYLAPEVNARASMFVHIISIGLLPFAAYRALYGYSASINQTKPVMVIALVGLAVNILVNWLLIFGQFGLPKMGALGCAVASGTVVWLDLLAIVLWIRIAPAYRASYPFDRWEWPHWPEVWSMLKLGVPIGVTYFAEVSVFGAVSLLVARFGVVTVSAHQIALNFSALTFMVPLSFGIGMITRVGQALGEGNPQRARFASFVGLWMALGFAVLSALGIAVFRYQIAAAYTSDVAVQQMCAHLLLFAAVFQLSDAAQVAASCAIRGYKVTRGPMLIQTLAFWGVALPLGCVLGLAPQWVPFAPAEPMSATGFWIGLVLGLTVAAVLLVAYLNRLSRQRALA
ncbi:MATE family multidrug resistance protein [Pseudoduganella lurida]|uniref:Multidrug-efflux transporter n=1 Tax=Pseudoduganella lurida TaxID=1036180 RepID=A0A562R8B5_9BURK|nr:MATE family efflux transporter [Pseudoduganella lurida]TWI65292.1 MATE family multidrug resistance protein [Pseudoduganella lurida]